VKKTLNLQQIIDLIKTLESMISSTQTSIIVNNPKLKKDTPESEVDVPALYQKYGTMLEQLNVLKQSKDKANRKRSGFVGRTNQDLIYDLSNLKKQQSLLDTLTLSKLKGRNGKEEDAYEFQISKSEIANKLVDVELNITKIKKSMKDFNTSTTVKVVIFEELKLL